MEELLNKLIEKGRNVFGHKDRINAEKCKYSEGIFYEFENHNMSISLRELVSKESGLWQFVCENGMVKNANDYSWELYNGGHGQYEVYKNGYEGGKRWEQVDYEYRIIESALKDESELEQFLLDNIKI